MSSLAVEAKTTEDDAGVRYHGRDSIPLSHALCDEGDDSAVQRSFGATLEEGLEAASGELQLALDVIDLGHDLIVILRSVHDGRDNRSGFRYAIFQDQPAWTLG